MILNDFQIKNSGIVKPCIFGKQTEILGFKVLSFGCSGFGVDIRLDPGEFAIISENEKYNDDDEIVQGLEIIDPKNFNPSLLEKLPLISDETGDYFILPGHTSGLGFSIESFNIPKNVLGTCFTKSTYARSGIFANITPLEPNWKGYLTIEIHNFNKKPCKIYAKEGIAQIVFHEGITPTEYYSDEGKYQNQKREIVLPKV
jgi:dCTP deaminase